MKTFEKIVAPLEKVRRQLQDFVSRNQQDNEADQSFIVSAEVRIAEREIEISRAQGVADKINNLIS